MIETFDLALAALQILFLGDSHATGSFGVFVDQNLRDVPQAEVLSVGSCGSVPHWFFSGQQTRCGYWERGSRSGEVRAAAHATPLLPVLLNSRRPDVMVVQLGANFVVGYPDSVVRAQTREFVRAISTARPSVCVWAGPPTERLYPPAGFDSIYRAMSDEIAESCTLIDSRLVTSYPATGGDGMHYDSLGASGRAIARGWADAVVAVVKKRLNGESLDPSTDPVYRSP